MQRTSARPEFEHVAKDGDAPTARPRCGLSEQSERRRDRRRIGVVALVEHECRAAGQVDFDQRAAAGSGA